MPPHNSHLTTEQFSAFLDQQLSAQEQSLCQTHLNDCELCQQQLVELQQTILLVHALPRVPAPRSFVLPVEPTIQSEARTGKEDPAPKIARQAHKRVLALPSYVRTTIRIASTLVAVLGLFFIVSGLLTVVSLKAIMHQASIPSGMSAARISTPFGMNKVQSPIAPGISAAQAPNPSSDTSPQQPFAGGAATQTSGLSPSTSPQQPLTGGAAGAQSSSPSLSPSPQQLPMSPSTAFFNPGTPEGHLSIGLLLFIAGIVSVLLFSRLGKQARQDQSQQ